MSRQSSPELNYLLASLPEEVWKSWLPHLQEVELPLGKVLYESGCAIEQIYFPTTSVVSLLYVTGEGCSTEIAIVGNEGVVGVALFMGGDSTPNRAVVQSAGYGFRLKASFIKSINDFATSSIMQLMMRYTLALITQISQTAVCNRHHSLDQQLCRWLLISLDRLQGNDLEMTQELIANMLGVRREGVTQAAIKLQNVGLIKYVRVHITVLNRSGLENRTCECYSVVKKEYDRLLPKTNATEH